MHLDRHLFDGYRASLRSFLAPRVRDSHDIDDVLQDTFLRFHSCSPTQDIASPLGYLHRIALNLIVDRSRRRSPLTNAVHIDAVAESWLGSEPRQEHSRRFTDLEHAYHAAMAELSPRCREVFHLRRHEEMATPDVAAKLSITPRMVQKHMVAAMAHLQDRLRPFLTEYDHGSTVGRTMPCSQQKA